MWQAFIDLLIYSLDVLHNFVGSYGLAIILFTVLVRLLTLPLTMKQIRSSQAMQELQPKIKELQVKYKNDREKQTQEMMRLYQEHGFNPAAGCLPLLIQMPLWIALYQALFQMTAENKLNEGWLFLPSLAEPNGWEGITTLGVASWPYWILPILTVFSQMIVQKMMTPTAAPTTSSGSQEEDPTAAMMKQMGVIMPVMIGYITLISPSGLGLYWVTSNIFAIFQQALVTGPQSIPYIGPYISQFFTRDENRSPVVLAKQEAQTVSVSPANGYSNGQATEKPRVEQAVREEKEETDVNVTTTTRKRKKRRG